MNKRSKDAPRKKVDSEEAALPKIRVMTHEEAAENPRAVAHSEISPTVRAAATISAWSQNETSLDIVSLVEELVDQGKAINDGCMHRLESMLTNQAHTLDAIFHKLLRRAVSLYGGYMPESEPYLRLAFRAQSQCRATIETLATIKNPQQVAFVHQANISHGPQQVNNEAPPKGDLRVRENQNQQNELLEVKPHERLDTGTAKAAGGLDPTMATLEPVQRSQDDRREGTFGTER